MLFYRIYLLIIATGSRFSNGFNFATLFVDYFVFIRSMIRNKPLRRKTICKGLFFLLYIYINDVNGILSRTSGAKVPNKIMRTTIKKIDTSKGLRSIG